MPADTPYNPDGSIDWSYFNRPAVKDQVYVYDTRTGGYDIQVPLAAARVEGYGALSDTEKREIYNQAAILNPQAGNEPFIIGQPAVGQEYQSMNTGAPVETVKPVTTPAVKTNGGNGKMANGQTGDNVDGMELLGMDVGGILSALGIGGTAAAVIGGAASILGGLRTKWPWQTVEGEGMIAPWSQMTETSQGWVQQGGVQGVGGIPGAVGAVGTVARSWTNAAKDGSTPATANFIQMVDGRIYAQSLKTGVIRRVPKPRMVHLHSNMSLGTYIRAEKMLDRMAGRIAKRTKSLKRAK